MSKLPAALAALALVLAVGVSSASAHVHPSHRARHHHATNRHHRAHRAATEVVEYEATVVNDDHVLTPDEEAENRVAVEASEGQTWGEPPTTPREEETPAEPEP